MGFDLSLKIAKVCFACRIYIAQHILREGLKWKARSVWACAAAGLVAESPTRRSKGHAQMTTKLKIIFIIDHYF